MVKNSDIINDLFITEVFEQIESYEKLKPLNLILPEKLMRIRVDEYGGFIEQEAERADAIAPKAPAIQIGGECRKKKDKKETPISHEVRHEQIVTARETLEALADSTFQKKICAALQSGTNDAFEIGKLLTPVLLPLSLAGTIAIPATPIAFAAVSLIIARVGVSILCSGITSTVATKN